jgi:hypothetical protein
MKAAAAIGLILLLAMCQNKSPYEREMASISALQVAVDSAISTTHRIDTDHFRLAESRWSEKLNLILNEYQSSGDSIPDSIVTILADYQQGIAHAAWTADHTDLLLRELALTRNQLDNLYHDLAYNLLDANGVKGAYDAECTAADSAIARAEYLSEVAAEVNMYPETELKIDSVIERLKTN